MDAALLLDAIGLPREAFTPVFAVARAPAWIAHALEQQAQRPHDPPDLDLCRAPYRRGDSRRAWRRQNAISPLSPQPGGSLKGAAQFDAAAPSDARKIAR